MGDEGIGVDAALDHAEAVINPVRGSRIALKIVALIVVVLLCAFTVRLVVHYLWRSEDVSKTVMTDRVWFARTAEEIRALDLEIQQGVQHRGGSQSDFRAGCDRQ